MERKNLFSSRRWLAIMPDIPANFRVCRKKKKKNERIATANKINDPSWDAARSSSLGFVSLSLDFWLAEYFHLLLHQRKIAFFYFSFLLLLHQRLMQSASRKKKQSFQYRNNTDNKVRLFITRMTRLCESKKHSD